MVEVWGKIKIHHRDTEERRESTRREIGRREALLFSYPLCLCGKFFSFSFFKVFCGKRAESIGKLSRVDTTHTILRSARHFLAGTFLSRLSGMLRDVVMAFCFGTSPEIAAFFLAYRLANLFRRLLGEGNLQGGITPLFEGAKSEGRASAFFRDTTLTLGAILLLLVLLIEASLFGASHWVSPDWQPILRWAMWMSPGLFFICLYGLNLSFLQSQKKYFAPAAAPVFFNLVWIGSALWVRDFPQAQAMTALSIAVTGAFAAQWLFTVVDTRRLFPLTFKEWLSPPFFHMNAKALFAPLALGTIGIGAVQFNAALDAIFARLADASGPAFLWYAIRVEQLPLALFGIALSGALLPPLARAMREGALDRYRELLQSALKHSAALMLPCTFGIWALGGVGLNLLYGHGQFTAEHLKETTLCLSSYGIGLIPSVFVLLLSGGFYAQKSYRIPSLCSVASVCVNIGLNAFFVFGLHWGAVSIAIATSLSAWLNAYLLTVFLKKSVGEVFGAEFWRFFFNVGICSALPALCVAQIQVVWMGGEYPREVSLQVLQLGVLSGLYLLGFGFCAWLFRLRELLGLFKRSVT